MKEKIKKLIKESLDEIKDTNNLDFEVSEATVLLGENSVMDSFDFVSFVATLEEKLSDEFGKEITLVSEKAFSKKYSPFKNIDRITDYVIELLNEAE